MSHLKLKLIYIFSVIFLILFSITDFRYNKIMETKTKIEIDSIRQIITPYVEISKISKTIITVYDISKYEADTYAYIASKFEGKWNDYIAMIKVESNFKAGLMSSKNCKGLTQLHPNTMKEICNLMGIRYEDDLIWNDILNVYAGFMYLNNAMKADSLNMFRIYVGGPNWAKADPKNKEYIFKYDRMIKKESKILELVYKGLNN